LHGDPKAKNMTDINIIIRELASGMQDDLTAMRRHLHMHPELSTEEVQTAAFISGKLSEYGIPHKTGIAGTGIVGLIEGAKGPGLCIGLRADMDALPVNEENKTSYVSCEPGKMHACGHDVHMTCLLGAAKILNGMKDHFRGSVKLIFQPSEETYPGGAIRMIEEGVLTDPRVDHVIGQHVFPLLDAGRAGFRPGPYMASTDEVFLTVRGRGGHAASPHLNVDPVLIAAQIIVALQQIVSRNTNPIMPTVLSFGRIIGEGRTNITPDEVKIDGTVRTYDEDWRKEIHRKIETMASSIAVGMGGSCDVKIAGGYPFLKNDDSLTRKLRNWAPEYLGSENVEDLDLKMTAEDFSYFAREVPSCFYRIGIRNETKGITSNLHSSTFDVDESAIGTGTGLMTWLTLRLLNE
jgi:amidohydrolase